MLHDTPLRERHEQWARSRAQRGTAAPTARQRPGAAVGRQVAASPVEYISYGEPDEQGFVQCEIPATFGEVEAEYAAIRRSAGLMDCPQRGTLRITGGDRIDFLSRMLTAELKDLSPGMARAAFWLNRKGRIEADLLIAEFGEDMLAEVDIHQAAETVRTLSEFVITEEVEIEDVSAKWHRIAMHGPAAIDLLSAAAQREVEPPAPLEAIVTGIASVTVRVVRRDQTGEPGLELFVAYADAPLVWDALLEASAALGETRSRVRPIGWYAYNIARIEGGTPLFNIDFGRTNLPHETGILRRRVSFTKGCYLGQEVVARMESLGRPKQVLVGLRMKKDLLPVAQGEVFERSEGTMGEQIGIVTSSTLSPLSSAQPIAFAMLKSLKAEEGMTVLVSAEGEQTEAMVGPLGVR